MKNPTFLFSVLVILSLFACSKRPESNRLMVTGVENSEILLNGNWKFSMDPPEKFWDDHTDFLSWSDIQVPGECQMQGFAIKHDVPYVYKHQFLVPNDYDGKQILLNFYGVYSYARVWVNGQFVRDHFGGFTKWSCDITKLVKAGNEVTLVVEIIDRADDISYGSGYAKHQIGGILRDVELVALPKQHFKQLFFETDLDEEYKNAELKVVYELTQSSPAKVKMELFDNENNLVTQVAKDLVSSKGELRIPVTNPHKWDAEHPNLYTLVTTLFEKGEQILQTSEKIGFREVVVEGNKLLVNGKPVKLRGACRHDIHPTLGRTTTKEYDKLDVQLAKECNMNFIRTSHYPPSEAFLDYCDEYGIYVEDETAVCFVGSHRTEAYRATGASANDSEYLSWYLTQLEEMVNNHRNHPSVLIWSIGNESTFGRNFVESYNWVKKNDLTRPVIYSYPGNVPDSVHIYDILSMHYPSWNGDLHQMGKSTKGFDYKKMPVIFDEWAHVACYNNFELKEDPNVRNFWSQSLDSMWTNLFEADGGLGGAIWCMMDETFMLPEDLEGYNEWWGILDPNVIPSTYMGPTVGYGEWGIIDTWRRKKPEFWGTKKAYSPTKIYAKQIECFQPDKQLIVPVHNRFDHTNFSELKIIWKYGDKSGVLKGVNIHPHAKGELVFPVNDWNSEEKLTICFYQNDNFLVDEYNLQLGERKVELPVCQSGKLNVKENDQEITISGKSFQLAVSKQTGLLENVKVNDEVVIKSGPYINLKFPGNAVQYSTLEMDDYAKNWKLTDVNCIVEDGMATINTTGNYDGLYAGFTIQIDENGVFAIDYEISEVEQDKFVQEIGVKFLTGDNFTTLSWDREGYFTAYPEDDPGRAKGQADLTLKTKMNYRQKPNHSWELDTKGYYYFGLDEVLPYTNIVRALKENIYSYSLQTAKHSKLEVLSEGEQACRFDRIAGENTLIINDQWDYTSLGWGNYYKRIKADAKAAGQLVMILSN
ncbi:MAG: hypothetical protein JEZ14_12780 [Marinilabiliaceae bacterium]|nr:hypothetical protein [Marinilabiliaceae bacterium]